MITETSLSNLSQESVVTGKVGPLTEHVNAYTYEQCEIIKNEILAGNSFKKIANKYAPLWNRTVDSVYQKIRAMAKEPSKSVRVISKKEQDPLKMGLQKMLEVKIVELEKVQNQVSAIMLLLNA